MHTSARNLTVAARDGFPLAVTVHAPTATDDRRHVVVVAPAAGVRRRFYRSFAASFAEHGFTVVSFDYRGMGDSQRQPIQRCTAELHDWGEGDLAGVIDWSAASFPDCTLSAVAHSLGGQLIGLADSNERLQALITVGAQSGYWKHWRGGMKWALWCLWHVAMPVLAHACSCFPARQLRLGESLPRGVALEWARWSRDPRYLFGESQQRPIANFQRLKAPIRAYSFADDRYAPRAAVDALHAAFIGARVERLHVAPADIGQASIGHFDFFRAACGAALWRESMEWLVAQAKPPCDSATQPKLAPHDPVSAGLA